VTNTTDYAQTRRFLLDVIAGAQRQLKVMEEEELQKGVNNNYLFSFGPGELLSYAPNAEDEPIGQVYYRRDLRKDTK